MAKVTASQSNYTIVNLYTTKVDLLIARKDEISIRFDVQMDLEKPEGSGVSGCWVNIAGSPKKVETAKVGSYYSLSTVNFAMDDLKSSRFQLK